MYDKLKEINQRGVKNERLICLPRQYLPVTAGLVARPISQRDFAWADYIICMDNMNLAALQRMAPASDLPKIHLANELVPGHENEEIPDPWYTHRFEETYQSLYRALPLWLIKIEGEL